MILLLMMLDLFLPSSSANEPIQDSEVIRAWRSNTYSECKAILNNHFTQMYLTQQLMWPRAFSADLEKTKAPNKYYTVQITANLFLDYYVT